MKKLIRFWKKCDFPIHLIVVWDRLCNLFFCLVGTIWTKFILKIHRCSYGKGLKVDGFPRIRCLRSRQLNIGDYCKIKSRFGSNLVGRTTPCVFQCYSTGRISVGNRSGISFAVISSRASIEIGQNVNIGGNVRIFDHNYHSLNYLARRDGQRDQLNVDSAPIRIGDDVFIGTNTIILKGVTIGDRSIVAAGSVVSRSIPSDEIWGGNPARMIRKLEVAK